MNRNSERVSRGLPCGGINPFLERYGIFHPNIITTGVAGIRINKKRRPIWPPFFKEEERSSVQPFLHLIPLSAPALETLTFFSWADVFACLRTGDACAMNRRSGQLPCSLRLESGQ
jgi:hypothetical protein